MSATKGAKGPVHPFVVGSPVVGGPAARRPQLLGDRHRDVRGRRDRVLIFGHPFFQAGPVRPPLDRAQYRHDPPEREHVVQARDGWRHGRHRDAGPPRRRRGTVSGSDRGCRRSPCASNRKASAGFPLRGRRGPRMLLPQLVNAAAMNCVMEAGGGTPMQTCRVVAHAAPQQGRVHDVRSSWWGSSRLAEATGVPRARCVSCNGNPFEPFSLDSIRRRSRCASRRAAAVDACVTPRCSRTPCGWRRRAQCARIPRLARQRVPLRVAVPRRLPDGVTCSRWAAAPKPTASTATLLAVASVPCPSRTRS